MRITGISCVMPRPAIVIKQEVSDEVVLDVLRSELSLKMEKPEVDKWMDTMVSICKRTGIEPRRLPVNSMYPGSLTPEENHEILMSVMDTVI